MSTTQTAFDEALTQLYQGEMLGEIIFDQLLGSFPEPEQQRKVAAMLQLETETKARLRPAMLAQGLELAEPEGLRPQALEIAASLQGKTWPDTLNAIRDIVVSALVRYEAIAQSAPTAFKPVADYMVEHERALLIFTDEELAGNTNTSLDCITSQLQHKI